jgi:hypothetical protein
MQPVRYLFLIGGAAMLGSPASDTAGDVIQIQGTWFIGDRSSPLLAGESVPAGALIKADPDKGQGFVVVALLNKKQLNAACTATPCTATLQIPADALSPDITFKNILAAVQFVLLHRGPEVAAAYEPTSGRGSGTHRSEILLPFDRTKNLSFAPELNLSNASYDVTILRVKDQQIAYTGEVELDGTNLRLPFAPPDPGLYVVSLKNRLGVIAADILLDLIPTASYEKVRQAYDDARLTCMQWNGPQGSAAAHMFLRAYLVALEGNP